MYVFVLVEFSPLEETTIGRRKKKERKKEKRSVNERSFFFRRPFVARLIRGVKNGTVSLQEVSLKP